VRCGEVPTEDGPIGVQVVSGPTDCTQAVRILGSLVGGIGPVPVDGDYETGWTVGDWACRVEGDGLLTYTCVSPQAAVISTWQDL
jgi:hypothetical protein